MKLTKETFLLCKGCKYNAPYNGSESACQVQETMYREMMLQQGEAEDKESCENKQERVYVA
jgi:hypothetical protein